VSGRDCPSFVISGLLLAVMIGDSWYGAVSLLAPLIIMLIVLMVVAFSQWRAISVAKRDAGNAPGQY
jgi:hypothetical protein